MFCFNLNAEFVEKHQLLIMPFDWIFFWDVILVTLNHLVLELNARSNVQKSTATWEDCIRADVFTVFTQMQDAVFPLNLALKCGVVLNLCMKCQTGLCWTRWLWKGAKTRPASPNHHVRSALFWDITQHRVVIPYRCFGTTYWSRVQRSRYPKRENLAQLKLTETSFLGLQRVSNFLKKHDVSEAGPGSLFR